MTGGKAGGWVGAQTDRLRIGRERQTTVAEETLISEHLLRTNSVLSPLHVSPNLLFPAVR